MWHKDDGTEQLMTKLGIGFEYQTNIPVKKVKVGASLKNNARFSGEGAGSGIIPEAVKQYEFAMKSGTRFPAPVLSKDFLIHAGNQRFQAAINKGDQVIDAYVITGSEEAVAQFRYLDNIKNGINITDEQRINAAVDMHNKYGTDLSKLNDEFFGGGFGTYNQMCVANQAFKMRTQLQDMGIYAAKFPVSTLAALHPLREAGVHVLRAAGSLMTDYSLNGSVTGQLTKTVMKAPTEAERLSVIAEARKEIDQKTKRPDKPKASPDVIALRREIVRFRKFLENGGKRFPSIEKLTDDAKCVKEVRSNAAEIINLLRTLKEKV